MKKSLFLLTAFVFFSNNLCAQNSMTGDGFGGRGWYKAHNYQVGSYAANTVCGIDSQLYGWGNNSKHELGDGTILSSGTPVAAIGMTKVKFYTTGYISAGIKSNNEAWVWGGQPGYTNFSNTPSLLLTNVKFVDAGQTHIVFVKNDGTVWGAGRNDHGQLGNGSMSLSDIVNPVQMTGISNAVRAIALGSDNYGATMILLNDGTVKITGGGGVFQASNSAIPVAVNGLSNIVDIKGSTFAAFALQSDGDVYSFGANDKGILGIGSTSQDFQFIPTTKITFPPGAAPIVAVSANNDGYHCLALDSNRNLYGWGRNIGGELGDGNYLISQVAPKLLSGNVIDIFAGETFSYILKGDNTLWATGASISGSIWMNVPDFQRNVFTQIDPTIAPMNLCAPKVWGVVPIKLSTFTCVANGNNAVLNWQSDEEINAGKYIVQYSNDGRHFTNIATLIATGSNSKYNYIHQQVSGTSFYRLKMMDKDGSFKYSEIRVVRFNTKAGIIIAPNPANDVISVFTKNNTPVKTIQVISYDGRISKTIDNYDPGQQISISKFASGTYVLKIIYVAGEVEYGRFIKSE